MITATGVIGTALMIILLVYIILKYRLLKRCTCRSRSRASEISESQYQYFADENNIIESDT